MERVGSDVAWLQQPLSHGVAYQCVHFKLNWYRVLNGVLLYFWNLWNLWNGMTMSLGSWQGPLMLAKLLHDDNCIQLGLMIFNMYVF